MSDRFTKHIKQQINTIEFISKSSHLIETIAQVSTCRLRQNSKIFCMGASISATDCQHMAA